MIYLKEHNLYFVIYLKQIKKMKNPPDTGISYKAVMLESDSMHDCNEIINEYNQSKLQHVICHEHSPIHLLKKIDPKKLKIMLNYEIRLHFHIHIIKLNHHLNI